MNIKIKEMCFTALMAAVICVISPFSINIGPVPISLATFAVYLASAVLGVKTGTIAVLIYLAIGAVNVPVFSNFGAGLSKLTGPTGGYLVGYLPCAAITGLATTLFCRNGGRRFYWVSPIFMVIGTFVLYAMGTAWFMINTGRTLAESLPLCVTPFLPGDAAKIVLATALGGILRERLTRMGIL